MAVLNFPIPYTEELMYSIVARAGVRQGLTSPKQLLDEVFESRSIIATIDLSNHLATLSRWLPEEFTPDRLIYSHSLFPLYAPFVPEARRLQCMNWLYLGSQGAAHLALGIAASRIKSPRFVRYCPGCMAAQREQYGEYFWLREWQVAGVESCPEHGVLMDTRISRPLIERHRFIAAAPEHCLVTKQQKGMRVSDWITTQVRRLLVRPAQASPGVEQWTEYYRSLAYRLGFYRGKAQVDHSAIKNKVLKVWPAAWLIRNHLMPPSSDINDSDWLKAIFRKHRKSFNYLQHIVVHQALLDSHWQVDDVLDEVSRKPTGKTPQQVKVVIQKSSSQTPDKDAWLALLSSHPPLQARKISPALYARLYRSYRDWLLDINDRHAENKTKANVPRIDWDRRDRENLQALRQLATFLNATKQGPRRSKTYYLKLLGNLSTVEKNLHQMPRTSAFLVANSESVSQYQIRRLQNAYDDLRALFDSPPRWRLLRNAGLSEERMMGPARQYLENLVDTEHEVQRCRK
ncbi:TniQ family protein [Vibrio parahaemolyticus]|uniref:TnsD family transposase n=3 Tax=Bacteria TaxID=2 RepID=A0AAU6VX48_UNCXX|nr:MULTISPECIES: TnsD family Tn7-like transposition protein [Vibrio]HDM8233736.1 TniQ family protein [Vibrio campbellii]EGQ9108531.1 transcriptional antiterminator [Vibrio cholerae]EGR1579481.1 transcriptional antiterminator [Vibrio parahaemolyticus]EGU0166704.1 transcriptional antiterminator [Vibrio parahaemolyticus]EJB8417949.1 TniQ family protein [Vibrio vulnificus]